MKKIMKIIIPLILIVFLLTISILITDNNKYKDTITYKGKTYELLEHNMDIFTYFYNSNTYLEEDKIHKVSHNKWDILYFNGDLFVLDKQVKKTTKYYQDDKNYNWFITYERDDLLIEKEINLTKKELDYLYNIESIKKEHQGKCSIQRYKGLGEMNADQLWETTMNPDTRSLIRVNISDAALAEKRVSVLMGDKVEPRKEWINQNVEFTMEDNYRK